LSNLTNSSSLKHGDSDGVVAHVASILSPSATAYNLYAISCLCKLEIGSWILNSGTSDHMNLDPKTLYDLKLLENPVSVSLPNGHKVKITHHRKLKISDNIVWYHVLLVPHFKYNLLSVKRLAAQLQCQVVFTENLCILQGPSLKRPVAIGRESCNLYILDKDLVKGVMFGKDFSLKYNNMPVTCDRLFHSLYNHVSKQLNTNIWHNRMGHIPYEWMRLLPLSVDNAILDEDIPCDV